MAPHLPWNDELKCLLLNLVIVKGAHLKAGMKGIKEIWDQINTDFFKDELLKEHKKHYTPDSHRKIKDQFSSVMAEVQNNKETGNQSGKEGELSELFRLVRQITEEMQEKEEEAEAEAATKRKLNETDINLLYNNNKKPSVGWGTRKLLDGSVESSSTKSNSPTPSTSFESRLINILESQNSSLTVPSPAEYHEDKVRDKMIHWCETNSKSENDLLSEAKIAVDHLAVLEDVSLEGFVNLYCAKGKNFLQDPFATCMKEAGVPFTVGNKMYVLLQKWHKVAMVFSENTFASP